MVKDRIFATALMISVVIHTTFLFNWPLSQEVFFKIKPYNRLEVTYYNIKAPAKLLDTLAKTKVQKTSIENLYQKVGSAEKKETLLKKVLTFDQKREIESEKIIKEVFNIPKPLITDVKSDLKNKGKYDSYYRVIREKIRKAAILNQPRQFQEGSACLAFSIKKDGSLEGLKIINSKTNASDPLKDAALKSVLDASPFPPIPNELNQDSINFSVIISFVLEND